MYVSLFITKLEVKSNVILSNVAFHLCRIAYPNGVLWNVLSNYTSSSNHCMTSYNESWENGRTSSNGCSSANLSRKLLPVLVLGTRIEIIGEGTVSTNHYVVLQLNSIPQLHTTLHSTIVTNLYFILNQAMRTDIAVLTNLSLWKNYTELPDIGGFWYVLAHAVG